MIRYKEIAFVAYPVTDVARARKFYEGVLGLKPSKASPLSNLQTVRDPDGNKLTLHGRKAG